MMRALPGTREVSLPPGPSAPAVVQTARWYSRPYAFFDRCRRRHGHTFTIRLVGAPPAVMLTRPDDVQALFTAPPDVVHPGEGMEMIAPLVGNNSLILLDEERHMHHRKLMLPPLHGEYLRAILASLDEIVESTVATWPKRQPISILERSRELTLEVILRTVFGLGAGTELDAFRRTTTAFLDLGTRPTASLPQLRRKLGGLGAWPRLVEVRKELDLLLFGLIDSRAAAGRAAPDSDVLGMLLSARDEQGEALSREEVRDELLTLLVAGHETTATALAWAFERLGAHEEVRRALVCRLDAGEADEYLSAIVFESMRQRPVLANIGMRLVKQPIEIGGVTYRPGCGLTPNAYLLHHDSSIYPEPRVFRPERFLNRRPATYTWIPFGGGVRRCIGAALAIAEMEAVLRHVFARFEVHYGSTHPLPPVRRNITVTPKGGVMVALQPRKAVGAHGEGPASAREPLMATA